MSQIADRPTAKTPSPRPWVPPRVEDLTRLTDLTLQSIPGNCGIPGSGSTCF